MSTVTASWMWAVWSLLRVVLKRNSNCRVEDRTAVFFDQKTRPLAHGYGLLYCQGNSKFTTSVETIQLCSLVGHEASSCRVQHMPVLVSPAELKSHNSSQMLHYTVKSCRTGMYHEYPGNRTCEPIRPNKKPSIPPPLPWQ